jgi:hypothetical protein
MLTGGIGTPELLVFAFVALMTVFLVWPCWRICTKAGLPGPLGLVSLIPLGLLVLLYVWALMDWPVLRGGTSETGNPAR